MTVGERIKARREELHLSQGDLAKRMGVTRQAVSKAETHDDNITTEKVSKFAKALETTPSYLMGWGNHITPEVDLIVCDKDGTMSNIEVMTQRKHFITHVNELNEQDYQKLVQIFDAVFPRKDDSNTQQSDNGPTNT